MRASVLPLVTIVLVASAVVAGSPARAANWPMLLGTEEGRKETLFQPFGFMQLRVEATPFADEVTGLTSEALREHEGELAAFNLETAEFQVRRARLGARGFVPGTNRMVNYFLALEGGVNAATRDRGVILIDGSITLNLIPGLRLRAGQFKLPAMDETLEPNPLTADFINFSPLVDQLVFENPIENGRFIGSGYANRDVGIQAFDSFLYDHFEVSYAAMLSQGRMGGLDLDEFKDLTVRAQLSWLPEAEERWLPFRDEISVWAWTLQGGRDVDGEEVLRVRQGVGAHVELFHTRTRLELVRAEGALFAGQNPPFEGEPLLVIPDGEAWGWAFDTAIGGHGGPLGPFELDFGVEELYRLSDDDPRSRVFRNAIIGAQWHFSNNAKLMANWELRHIITPSSETPEDARLIASSIADLVGIQLVALF